jgi:hypothetical protein
MAEDPKQMNIRQTWRALSEKNLLFPAHFVYDVAPFYAEDEEREPASHQPDEVIRPTFFKKVMRPSDHSLPPVWECDHEHPTWNEAVSCTQTPLTEEERMIKQKSERDQ